MTAAQRMSRAKRRQERWGPTAEPPTTRETASVTPAAAGSSETLAVAALATYHAAVTELDRMARETDWRRSRYTPSTVLAPLQRAVTQAEAECRRLGVPVEARKQPAGGA